MSHFLILCSIFFLLSSRLAYVNVSALLALDVKKTYAFAQMCPTTVSVCGLQLLQLHNSGLCIHI